MDLEHIAPGQTWHAEIDSAVSACRVGIVVISGHWFDSLSPSGNPRLADEHDVLRQEIRTLLDSRKPVIVVMTPDTPQPHVWRLPDDISRLSQIQVVTITSATWNLVLDQLIRTIRPLLQPPLGEGLHGRITPL